MNNKRIILILFICLFSFILIGCGSNKLDTREEMKQYINDNYGKNYTLTLINSTKNSNTWSVSLKEKNNTINFQIENYLSPSIHFLDNSSFGTLKEYYNSTYGKEKSKILNKEIIKIVDQYPDIKYSKKNDKIDNFEVYNSNYIQFKTCINKINHLYNLPKDTKMMFFVIFYDENNNIINSEEDLYS